jgi:hypothetical protein
MREAEAEILPPRGRRELDVEDELARVARLANLLDAWFEIPGTSIRVGLDPLVGLIPGAGDALTFLASIYIVDRLSRLGVSRLTRARMVGNILIDLLVGAIPVLGDIFDVGFRANIRNLELARRDLGFA